MNKKDDPEPMKREAKDEKKRERKGEGEGKRKRGGGRRADGSGVIPETRHGSLAGLRFSDLLPLPSP